MENYTKSLLYLTYSVAMADGVKLSVEKRALRKVARSEGLSDSALEKFKQDSDVLAMEEMYKIGIEAVAKCNLNQKLRVYAWIYKMMEVDGEVDVREAKFLLYAMKASGLDLDQVVQASRDLTG